jgi:dihydrodipicolinate synthase/N-acetylneuraminate lyase
MVADLICPLSTPNCGNDFRQEEIDVRNLVSHVVAKGFGANILFPLGTTGEFYVLSMEDARRITYLVLDQAAREKERLSKRAPARLEVAVGITRDNLKDTLTLTRYAEARGADYFVLMALWIKKLGEGKSKRVGTKEVIKAVFEECSLRGILYSYPGKTEGKEIGLDLIDWIMDRYSDRLEGIKYSGGEEGVSRLIDACSGRTKVWTGNEILGLRKLSDGIVAGSSNVLPVAWGMAARRNYEEPGKGAIVADSLVDIQQVYAANPVPAFKYMLFRLGVISSCAMYQGSPTLTEAERLALDKLMARRDFKQLFKLNSKTL